MLHPPADPHLVPNRRDFARQLAGLAGLTLLGQLAPAPAQAQATTPGSTPEDPTRPVRVLVWCEGTAPKSVYPLDIDGTLAADLARQPGLITATGRLDEPQAGLSDESLDAADVLIWWGRLRHAEVPDERAEAVAARVESGRLGLVALHASCASKPFRLLMGSSCLPGSWREDGRPEHVSIQAPDHPIARGLTPFTIPRASMFSEPFAVPEPETVVMLSTWDSGETFRSGLTWTVGQGRVAYFRPGHDAFPVLFHPAVRQVIANAALWTAPAAS